MNQYTTEAEGNGFAQTYLNTQPWDDAVSNDRNKALSEGTRIINRINYIGVKTDANQENEFPRNADSEVPQAIKEACWLIALALLDGVDPELEFENLQMVAQGYANIRSTFDRENPPEHILVGVPSSTAWLLIKPFVRDPRSIIMDRIT